MNIESIACALHLQESVDVPGVWTCEIAEIISSGETPEQAVINCLRCVDKLLKSYQKGT
jgi:hypothetical protein